MAWPRVDPVEALDARLRDLVARMADCDNPITYEVLETEMDRLLEQRHALAPARTV